MRSRLTVALVALFGCGDDVVDADRTAEATAKIASCAFASAESFAVLSLPVLRDEDLACALDAGGCAETLACFGWRTAPRDCSMPDVCIDDDTLATCRGMLPIEVDCAAWYGNQGPLCVTGTSGEARCGAAMCAADLNECDGTIRHDCSDGVEQRVDCANLGQSCAVVGTDADCTNPTSTACTGEGRCDGDVLVACDGGLEHRLDCPAFVTGSTCVGTPGTSSADSRPSAARASARRPTHAPDPRSASACSAGTSRSTARRSASTDAPPTRSGPGAGRGRSAGSVAMAVAAPRTGAVFSTSAPMRSEQKTKLRVAVHELTINRRAGHEAKLEVLENAVLLIGDLLLASDRDRGKKPRPVDPG